MRSRGFTLLELVVVMAIFAVLSVMAYGGLGNILTARTQVAQSLERTAALQKGYLRLRNDFQQLRARPVRDNYGDTQPALQADRGVVEFTRGGWRNPLSAPRSALERVAYRVEDGRLLRLSWRVLDRATSSEPVELAVLDQVEDAQWRFLDDKLEWQAQWPSQAATVAGTADPAPPRAVELTLVLKDLGEVRYLFSARNAS